MTALAKLLPCPFCGKSVATLSNTDELSGRPDISFMHTVVCNAHAGGCGSTVGYEPDQDDAISTWNRRAALSPAELGGVENPDRYALRMLVAAGWVSESKANEALNIAHGFAKEPLSTPRAAEEEWLLIESAPRHGREMILLLTPSRFPQVAYSNTWWTAGFSVECKPTHWMPIPALPAALTPPSAKGE